MDLTSSADARASAHEPCELRRSSDSERDVAVRFTVSPCANLAAI